MENTQKTQLESASEQLAELIPNITTSDRQEANKEYSEFTVIQYLKGRGKNLDTAMNLLKFFRKRIEQRNQILENNGEEPK
jgi:hypothetical protein